MTDVVEIARGVVANHEPDETMKEHILSGKWDEASPMRLATAAVQAGVNVALENLNEAEAESVDDDA